MQSVRKRSLAVGFSLVLVSLVGAVACGSSFPSVIKDEMARSPRGTATIVLFSDFQCPFCRRMHATLAPVLERHKDQVRVVLRHVPLPSHPDALGAARAAVCAETLGASGDYTDALFTSPELSPQACEDLAVQRGIDRDRFRSCLTDRSTDARIENDTATFDALEGDGVPLLYIGRTRLEGVQPAGALEAAIDEAIASSR